jgi:hypothetical protein
VQTLAPEAAGFAKAKRKDRTPFSKQEDDSLLIGFGKHGGKWSSIQKDEELGLSHRRSTDLRDRFRNAFPDKYVGAGFKPPPAKRRRRDPDDQQETPQPTQTTFNIHPDLNATLPSAPMQHPTTIPTPVRREQLSSTVNSQLTSDTFSHRRLAWTNPHNATAQQEREIAMKLRRALDMSSTGELMGEDIPLDPGLSDVAYQPHGQNHNAEALTGLLDAAVQQGTWKRE